MRVVFAGTPDFSATVLKALVEAGHGVEAVYTQPDRPAGRGRKLRPSPVKALALERGLTVLQPRNLRGESQLQRLRDLRADVMVVAAYGLILPAGVLDAPRLGCVNVHASLLPRWRGAAPIQRAILAGDSETGISIMQMDEGLDTGDVLSRDRCEIAPTDTAGTLHDRLAELGARALLRALEVMGSGCADAQPQDNSKACYAERLRKQEAHIDWLRPASYLERQVRAFLPWPVAYTTLVGPAGDELRLRVMQADLNLDVCGEAPGSVTHAGPDGIRVACGEGSLRLMRVQAPGRRPMSAEQFLNGHPIGVGTRLQ